MSAADGDLQAQVESVLGAMVKAAAAELIELFERRYGASAHGLNVSPAEPRASDKTLDARRSPSTGSSKRSIGVQVDRDVCSPPQVLGKETQWTPLLPVFVFGRSADLRCKC